jgi:signal transduction histidine kinase
MHDVVAHSLSVIIAQADGGRYASATDPEAGVRALSVIAETGRAALTDMRAILGVLRNGTAPRAADGGVGPAQDADRQLAPQPAAGDLEALVQQTREAGVAVSLVRVGTPRTLPAGVGLTLYRICQEALTNVLKHAGPAPSVTVLLRWSDEAVQLEVTDDGRGASAVGDGGGHGLLGMRERAAMFGGTVSAGPRPGGGFRVRVLLPTPRTVPAVAS